jgi:hypothetical protein
MAGTSSAKTRFALLPGHDDAQDYLNVMLPSEPARIARVDFLTHISVTTR